MTFLIKYGKVVRSTYYFHEKKDKKDKYDVIKNLIKSVYNKHKGRYGYRRITDELRKTVFFEYKNKLSMEENSILFKFAIGTSVKG
ncbi:helix-turn-helix protein [Sphingobacterium alimentarium]|uniref:Helix-turn-helix protein n=1 Tax=Sphingobacterium alimentarium TaxID=797292 RepID=A0A4R3VX10_9SPHI|nr:IS3 family transposase [Sphingobacterium alimentarium]TCV20704.1 helix-turn-helix protein [Sphingobacterium alimentarium]